MQLRDFVLSAGRGRAGRDAAEGEVPSNQRQIKFSLNILNMINATRDVK